MRTITATDASRNFKLLLDAVEGGESIAITRGGKTIAEIHPQLRRTAHEFLAAVRDLPEPSSGNSTDVEEFFTELRSAPDDGWKQRPWNLL